MTRIALIRNGAVDRVIESTMDFASKLGFEHAIESEDANPGWLYRDGVLVAPTPLALASTLDQAKLALHETVTAMRWEKETAGITVNGVRVLTGIEDQNRIASVLAVGPASVDFKAANGWVTLTLAQLQQIADAIGAHVQACFTAERAHHEAIDALTDMAAAQAYDVTTGWP